MQLSRKELAALPTGTVLNLLGYSEDLALVWKGFNAEGYAVVVENGDLTAYDAQFITERTWEVQKPGARDFNPPFTLPVAPYFVTSQFGGTTHTSEYTRLADACVCLVARRQNDPNNTHYLLDRDGFVIQRPVIKLGLSIIKREAEENLRIIAAATEAFAKDDAFDTANPA